MEKTKAIYTYSTKTYEEGFIKDRYTQRTKENGDEVVMDDYEILTLVTSSFYWKKNIGPTKLYTDKKGLEFLKGLIDLGVWDEVDSETLEEFYKNKNVNHRQFFAASKLYAISNEQTPFCSVDIDLLYRGNGKKLCKGELTTLHLEKITKSAYPTIKKFKEGDKSNILKKYKWRKKTAINCGLIYFNNQELVDRYVKESLDFMCENPTPFDENDGKATIMTLVEQRLLGEIANNMKIKVKSLVKSPFNNEQPLDFINETYHTLGIVAENRFNGQGVGLNGEVIHLWGHKGFLSSDLKVWDSILGGMKSEENENRLFLIFNLKTSLKSLDDELDLNIYDKIMDVISNNENMIKFSTFSRPLGLGPKENVYYDSELGSTDKIFGL